MQFDGGSVQVEGERVGPGDVLQPQPPRLLAQRLFSGHGPGLSCLLVLVLVLGVEELLLLGGGRGGAQAVQERGHGLNLNTTLAIYMSRVKWSSESVMSQ